MDARPIGIFDSGAGGLTVLHECLVTMPHEDFLYLGDGARCPYGPRPSEEIRRFAHEIAAYLEDAGVKLIVAACNSATAAVSVLMQGNRLLVCDGSILTVIDAVEGKILRTLEVHTERVTATAFSRDGKQILLVTEAGALRLVDAETGRPVRDFNTPYAATLLAAAFSADGKQLSAGENGKRYLVLGLNAEYFAYDEHYMAARLGGGDDGHGNVSKPDPLYTAMLKDTLLRIAGDVEVGWPEGLEVPERLERVRTVDVSGWEEACAGLPLSHMGRGPGDDPWFFAVAYAAGRVASSQLR